MKDAHLDCQNYVVIVLLCQAILCMRSSAQTVTVTGTVSTSTTVVRNASVTFEDVANPANSYSALTDSTGRYQVNIVLTSVAPGTTLPTTFELEQNYPNPFTGSTAISYKLMTQENVKVIIYDILGRVIRETSVGAQAAGAHSILWDGRNAAGHKVVPGVYFYCLQAGGQSQAMKMVLRAGPEGASPLQPLASSPVPDQPPTPPKLQRVTVAELFNIQVDTTSNTSPKILPRQVDSVLVQADTSIEVHVENQITIPNSIVYSDSVQQFIRGFGAANILPWRPDMTSAEVEEAFGAGPGQLGFTILRLRIPYTDDTTEIAANLPSATLAQSLGAIVFATPWTPPPALKTSNNIVGGMLIDTSYAAYAMHLKNFADFMANHGVPLYAVSVQNEPDANVTYESCSWNATQFLNFTKNSAAAIGTRVMMPESQNFVHALSDSTLNDTAAAANVSIIAGHIYGGGLGPYPLAVSKGKEIWMTEHLVLDTSWSAVLGTGKEIHDCLNAGMSAYVWWYIIRYYGPIDENGIITKRGYVMSQFSRFVRPGYYKIKCNAAPQRNVWISSYKDGSSSKVVIVALNMSASPVQQAFTVTDGTMTSFTPYTTSPAKNCQQGTDVPAIHGSITTTLEPSSITTFISH